MRYCARCKRPRDRDDKRTGKGQRLCKRCHRENMVEWRKEQRARMKYVQRVAIKNGMMP